MKHPLGTGGTDSSTSLHPDTVKGPVSPWSLRVRDSGSAASGVHPPADLPAPLSLSLAASSSSFASSSLAILPRGSALDLLLFSICPDDHPPAPQLCGSPPISYAFPNPKPQLRVSTGPLFSGCLSTETTGLPASLPEPVPSLPGAKPHFLLPTALQSRPPSGNQSSGPADLPSATLFPPCQP